MKRLILPLTLICAVAFYACKKKTIEPEEENEETTPIVTPEDPAPTFLSTIAYFNTWASQADEFQFSADLGGTFTTQKGSVLTIPANAFSNIDNSITTGPIDIIIKEVYSTKEMIQAGIYPISGSVALNSGGQFFIEATSNGNALLVTDGVVLNFEIPAQAQDQNMDLFFGGPEVDSANWEQVDTIWSPTLSNFTFSSADDTYSIELDSLGWGNIDAFMFVNYFDCTFNLTGLTGLNDSNTTAFAVFKNQNSVWPTGVSPWGTISNNVITETHLADVPMNIIVISVENGQLYYGLLDVTPTQGTVYPINMLATTSANLDIIIEGLE